MRLKISSSSLCSSAIVASLFNFFLLDLAQDLDDAPLPDHAFLEPDFVVERARIRGTAQDRFLLIAEAAEPQLELLHRLLVAQLLLLLVVDLDEFFAEGLVVLVELFLDIADLLRCDRQRQVGQLRQRLVGEQLGARLDFAVVGLQIGRRDIARRELVLGRGQQLAVVAQLGLAVPVDELVNVFLDRSLLLGIEVDVSVEPPVQQVSPWL
jgi:hypothetical protein